MVVDGHWLRQSFMVTNQWDELFQPAVPSREAGCNRLLKGCMLVTHQCKIGDDPPKKHLEDANQLIYWIASVMLGRNLATTTSNQAETKMGNSSVLGDTNSSLSTTRVETSTNCMFIFWYFFKYVLVWIFNTFYWETLGFSIMNYSPLAHLPEGTGYAKSSHSPERKL